ncbi:MAG: carbon starvation protein A [Candidatus Hydrogenedentes bacterium]|nr:carbon starvation protein A [Candidatus Hydrogenedentota bacterium]
MNILVFLVLAIAAFMLAQRVYGAYVARRLGVDAAHPTPACVKNDGRDFVPSKRHVVFAHHFSAIAGAGPILGPTMAILYGFVPAWLWVVIGGIFIGAVHDFTALFVSAREQGKSIAEVARQTLGRQGAFLFILFTTTMIMLVNASFLSAVTTSLTSIWPVDKLALAPDQTFLKTVDVNGVAFGRIGGIASTSVLIITLFSPILGWLMYKRGISKLPAYLLASAVCIGSILMGIKFPIILSSTHWLILISIYVLFASSTPVWVILQPRDFINVQILYAGIGLLVCSIMVAGGQGTTLSMPSFNIEEGVKNLGLLWPMMFITIACGAISGFHSLVSSGTTVKQISSETDTRAIGFNAMLLESLLAVCVLVAVGVGLTFDDYKSIVWTVAEGQKSNPILAFSLASGHLYHNALGIPIALGTVFGVLLVEGFVITTLDAAVRLNRYLFEELWAMLFKETPAMLRNHWVNSCLAVLCMLVLSYTNAFTALWPAFGAANQLLAALTLIVVTAWLLMKGRTFLFALIPAVFMIITTLASVSLLLNNYLHKGQYVLAVFALLMLALSAGVIALAISKVVLPAVRGNLARESGNA